MKTFSPLRNIFLTLVALLAIGTYTNCRACCAFTFQSAVPVLQWTSSRQQYQRCNENSCRWRVVALSSSSDEDSGLDRDEEREKEIQTIGEQQVACPGCDLCDGSGRIAGGIGAVLPWIPIKAYRPCPNFIERGGQYQRTGQGLDEIAFGRDNNSRKSSN